MADKLIYMEDKSGDRLFPHTSAQAVHMADGKTVEEKLANVNTTWEGVSGKPSTFPPSTHSHTANEVTGLHAVAKSGNYNELINKPTIPSAYTHPATHPASIVKHSSGQTVETEITNLKSSVVNGKQSVVNAINDKLGYTSGLTATNNSHDDYAWWIKNKIASDEKRGALFEKMIKDVWSAYEDWRNWIPPTSRPVYGYSSCTITLDPSIPYIIATGANNYPSHSGNCTIIRQERSLDYYTLYKITGSATLNFNSYYSYIHEYTWSDLKNYFGY